MNNHYVTNSAQNLLDIDNLITRKRLDPHTPETSATDEEKRTRDEEKVVTMKDEV